MIWSAFILGIAGSLHCVGMCGPIAVTITNVKGSTASEKLVKSVLYNTGRVLVYALLGFLFGIFGKGFYLAGHQQTISIVFGVLIILGVVFPAVLKKISPNSFFFSKLNVLKGMLFPLLKKQSYWGGFVVGCLNALLPCGLLYVALAGSVLTGNSYQGALYMFVFGLGTSFALLFLSLGFGLITQKIRNKMVKFIPVLMLLVGALFIVRGMNLGIPYLSPKMEQGKAVKCH